MGQLGNELVGSGDDRRSPATDQVEEANRRGEGRRELAGPLLGWVGRLGQERGGTGPARAGGGRRRRGEVEWWAGLEGEGIGFGLGENKIQIKLNQLQSRDQALKRNFF